MRPCGGGNLMNNTIKKEVLGRTIEAWLTWRGKDLLVTVTGGDAAHIGSVSVCRMCGGEPRLEKILLPAHRDDVVGDKFAQALAQRLNTTVCVVSGIHFDGVSKQDIAEIVRASDEMLVRILEHFD